MNMLSKIDQELRFAQTALGLRAQRQEVIASNLANADTPNYKARDFDFASTLKSALGEGGGPLTMATTSSRHISGLDGAGGVMDGALKYRSSLQPSLDGNTVDPDVERANFSDNAMHYQFLLQSISDEFQKMKLAVSADK
jgi:flagellar basal-body rod protein FlgB